MMRCDVRPMVQDEGESIPPRGENAAAKKAAPASPTSQNRPSLKTTRQRCPKCGSDNLHIEQTETQNITRMERTVSIVTTHHTINLCRCLACSRKDIIPKTNLPKKCSYDASIVTKVADNFAARMPFKVMTEYMSRHGIKISTDMP